MLAAAPLSLVKMILDGSHLHSLSGGGSMLGAAATAGPAPAPANSLFLLPASRHISPSPKQCKQKKLLSVPPHNIAHSVAGCLLVP